MKYTKNIQRAWYGNGGSGGGGGGGCCYTLTTVAALQALQTAGTMVQGTFYQITDVTADWQVVVLAESGTEISTQGQGIYQNTLYTEAWYDLATNTLYRIYDPLYNNDVQGSANISWFLWNDNDYYDNIVEQSSTIIGNKPTNFFGNTITGSSFLNFTGTIINLFRFNYIHDSSVGIQNSSHDYFQFNYLYNSFVGINNTTVSGIDSCYCFQSGLNVSSGSTINYLYAITLLTSQLNAQSANLDYLEGDFISDGSWNLSGTVAPTVHTYNNLIQSADWDLQNCVLNGTVIEGNRILSTQASMSSLTCQNITYNTIEGFCLLDFTNAIISGNVSFNTFRQNSSINCFALGGTSIENNTVGEASNVSFNNASINAFSWNQILGGSIVNFQSAEIAGACTYNTFTNQSSVAFTNSKINSFTQNTINTGLIIASHLNYVDWLQNSVLGYSQLNFPNHTGDTIIGNTFDNNAYCDFTNSITSSIRYNNLSNSSINCSNNANTIQISWNYMREGGISVNPSANTMFGSGYIGDNFIDYGNITFGATADCENCYGNHVGANSSIFLNSYIIVSDGCIFNFLGERCSLNIQGAGTYNGSISYNYLDGFSNFTCTVTGVTGPVIYNSIREGSNFYCSATSFADGITQNQLHNSTVSFISITSSDGIVANEIYNSNVSFSNGSPQGYFEKNIIKGSTITQTDAGYQSTNIRENIITNQSITFIGATVLNDFAANTITRCSALNIQGTFGSFVANTWENSSISLGISPATLNPVNITGNISYNTITQDAVLAMNGISNFGAGITHNEVSSYGYVDITDLNGNQLSYNVFTGGGSLVAGSTNTITSTTENTISSASYISLASGTTIGTINRNQLEAFSKILIENTHSNIEYNTLLSRSQIVLQGTSVTSNVSYNTVEGNSQIDLSDANVNFCIYNILNDAEILANSSTIGNIEGNTIDSASTLDCTSATLNSIVSNTISETSDMFLRCINAGGSILNNKIANSSLFTLGGAVASTFTTIQDNTVMDYSFFRDNNLGAIGITDIRGNTLTSYATLFLFQNSGSQFLGNIVTAGTMYCANNYTGTQTNFNHVLRANMTLGNGLTISQVRSNHIVGPSSGTYGNLSIYGPITMITCEGNNIFNAGRIEMINTVPTTFNQLDWNFVTNTSTVTFANCTGGRFGGAIIGDKGGNVIDNGSVLTFSGSTVGTITNNTFSACVYSSTNDLSVNMRNNTFSSTTLTTNASTVPMNDNTFSGGSSLSLTSANGTTINNNQVSDSFITLIGSGGSFFDNILSAESNIAFTNATGAFRSNYLKASNISFTSGGDAFDVRFNTFDQSLMSTGSTTNMGQFQYNTLLSESQVVFAGGYTGTETITNNYLFKSTLDLQNAVLAYPVITQNTLNNSSVTLQGGGAGAFASNAVNNSTINSLGSVDDFSYNDLSVQSVISILASDELNILANNKLVGGGISTNDTTNRIDDISYNLLNVSSFVFQGASNPVGIYQNTLTNNSQVIFTGVGNMYYNNNYQDSSALSINITSSDSETYNQFYNSAITLNTGAVLVGCAISNLSGTIETAHAGEVANPFNTSTFLYFVNCNDPAVLNAGNLTLTIEQAAFGGVFWCYSVPAGVNDVDNIVNFTGNGWICTFYWTTTGGSAGSLRFRNGVGTVVLKSSSPANIVLDSQPEYITLQDWFGSGNQYEIDHASY